MIKFWQDQKRVRISTGTFCLRYVHPPTVVGVFLSPPYKYFSFLKENRNPVDRVDINDVKIDMNSLIKGYRI